MSVSPQSREETPSTSSSQHSGIHLEETTSSGMSNGGGSSQGQDEADKFRKRMELEQTMQVLQQRLKLASVKAENGWSGMTLNEIEDRLPPSPRRGKRDDMRIATDRNLAQVAGVPYEPPSPSRPWQLIDVLWQPLPPPSKGYPASPSSPLKRSRNDDDEPRNPHRLGATSRRASASFHSQSPIDQVLRREKKRSQSHSQYSHSRQDVNAAQALTEMLGSASPGRQSQQPSNLADHASLPLPPAFSNKPARRALSATPGPVRAPRTSSQPDEEDKDAAELMMFLAHSPSASRKKPDAESSRNPGGAARVLFADDNAAVKVERHSNLALAPPITARNAD